jgi:hypothetical protein
MMLWISINTQLSIITQMSISTGWAVSLSCAIVEFTTWGTASGHAIGRKALILDYITHSVALVIFPAPYFIVTHGSLHTNNKQFRIISSDCQCAVLVVIADIIRTWWLMQALHAAVSLASGVGGGVGGVGAGVGARHAEVALAEPRMSHTGRAWVRSEPQSNPFVFAHASRPASRWKSPVVPDTLTAPYTPALSPVRGIFTVSPGIGNSWATSLNSILFV